MPCTEKIVFTSRRDGDAEIYVMDADGSNVTQLTDDNYLDTHPAFSPDGSEIVFEYRDELYAMNADGSDVRQLTFDGIPYNEDPAFSPDGSRIAYAYEGDDHDNYDIFVMGADGSNPTNITNHPAGDSHPSYGLSCPAS